MRSYIEIRLEALKFNPEAYGTEFESENARPLSWFADRLDVSSVFGAFDGSELAGVAAFSVGERPKERHKGLLGSVYVRPGARKAGVGRRLVETIIDFARPQVELIQLAVVNENARRL
jgi:GNAT superfamily N-acetyltransferase